MDDSLDDMTFLDEIRLVQYKLKDTLKFQFPCG